MIGGAGWRGLPRHLRRHRQPHAACGRAGRDRRRRGRPGSRERDARPCVVDAAAGHRGVELSGKPQPGITATDVVLALTEFLRKEKVVGAYLEFRGEAPQRSRSVTARQSRTWPRIRCHRRDVLHRPEDHRLPKLTGRDETSRCAWSKPTPRRAGLWADALPPPSTSAMRCASIFHRGAQHGRPVEPAPRSCRPARWPSAASRRRGRCPRRTKAPCRTAQWSSPPSPVAPTLRTRAT